MLAGWRCSSHGRPHTRAGARRRHVINEVLERLARADQVAFGERLLHVGWLRPATGAAPALAAAGSQHRHEGQDADGHSHCRRQHHRTHGSTTGGLGGFRERRGKRWEKQTVSEELLGAELCCDPMAHSPQGTGPCLLLRVCAWNSQHQPSQTQSPGEAASLTPNGCGTHKDLMRQ